MTDEPELFGEEGDAPSPLFTAARAAGNDQGHRGPGRPKGAKNRKTADFEKWFFARYRDPAQALGELVTMSVMDLHALVCEGVPAKHRPGLLEVIKLQVAVAGELMPYLHGKKPTQVNIVDERLPALIIDLANNQLDQMREVGAQKALSIGAPEDVEKARNSGVSEDEE